MELLDRQVETCTKSWTRKADYCSELGGSMQRVMSEAENEDFNGRDQFQSLLRFFEVDQYSLRQEQQGK